MAMHAAPLDSPRLQRVLAVLQDGKEHSTRDLMVTAHVCAVSAIASELRAHGFDVQCRVSVGADGGRVWLYQLAGREPSPGDPGPDTGSEGRPLPSAPAPASLAAAGGPKKGAAR